jgi:hypothetical protein
MKRGRTTQVVHAAAGTIDAHLPPHFGLKGKFSERKE